MMKWEVNSEVVIEPNRGLVSIDWKSIWHYRDLLFLFSKLEYVSKVKQTILGPLWYILHPILTAVVFIGIFTEVVKITSSGLPPMLFYLSGLLAWSYFSQCLISVSGSLTSNAHLFRKVYLPRLIVPLSMVFAKLIPFVIQLGVFLCFYAYYKWFTPAGASLRPNWMVLAVPLLLLQMAALSLGIGLCLAAISVQFRDLQQVVGMLVQLWMYATPIIYPGALLSERWRTVLALNPMAPVIDGFRHAFFGSSLNWSYVGISVSLTVAWLILGIYCFQKVESTFIDTV